MENRLPETEGRDSKKVCLRPKMLPYGRQWIDDDDIAAVVEVLRSDWLTTGPNVAEFERAFAAQVGAPEAVAVSSGTAALHAAMYALGIGPGDEVIVPPMSFAATANCIVYQGGTPIFADVEPDTLLLDPQQVEAKITPRTRAIICVDYAGQPCRYDAFSEIARRHNLALVADACHALGASYRGQRVGTLADLTAFSLHPVKHITTGEGGMVTTKDPALAQRMRCFRNHGISTDHRQREEMGSWHYEMVDLGYNYRITDFQCALGLSQLRKLHGWIVRRQEIARRYDTAFKWLPGVKPLRAREDASHAYHLYVMRLDTTNGLQRENIFGELRAAGIGANVHYIPIHLHPFYQTHFKVPQGELPNSEQAYQQLLSLPIFPAMTSADVDRVAQAVHDVIAGSTTFLGTTQRTVAA